MSSVRLLAALVLLVPVYVFCLQCAICPFKIDEPHNLECLNETCTGDVCKIVVNRYYNATIIAGCMQLREEDSFDNKALCYRSEFKTVCACSTEDMCNDPSASLSNFEFTNEPFLEHYQFMPQISPNPAQVSPLGGEVVEGSLASSTNNETLTVQSAMTVLPPSEPADSNGTLAETVEANTEVEPEAEGSGSIATDVPLMESTTMRKLTSALGGQDIVLTKTVNLEVGEDQNATEIPLSVTSIGNNLMNVDEVASTESNQNVQPGVTGMGSVENAQMASSSESPIEGQQGVGQAIESEAAAQSDASSTTLRPADVSSANGSFMVLFGTILSLSIATFSL